MPRDLRTARRVAHRQLGRPDPARSPSTQATGRSTTVRGSSRRARRTGGFGCSAASDARGVPRRLPLRGAGTAPLQLRPAQRVRPRRTAPRQSSGSTPPATATGSPRRRRIRRTATRRDRANLRHQQRLPGTGSARRARSSQRAAPRGRPAATTDADVDATFIALASRIAATADPTAPGVQPGASPIASDASTQCTLPARRLPARCSTTPPATMKRHLPLQLTPAAAGRDEHGRPAAAVLRFLP